MCRHLLPHFDLRIAQVVHNVGRFVANHPTSTVAALLVPLAVVVGVMVHHRLRRPIPARPDPSRAELRRDLSGTAPRVLLIAHQG